jgi:DNA-binding PadR family transcriptional regulator
MSGGSRPTGEDGADVVRTAEEGSDQSRTAVLGYAILGLLAVEPLTGYQLAQRMRAPIDYMWTAAHSQIYPELAKLLADGQVRATVIPGRGPRDTKRYTITTAGRRALQDWVDSPVTEVARSELLLRVRSLWLISPERARAFIVEQRARYEEWLKLSTEEELAFAPMAADLFDPTTPASAAYATLHFGIGRVRHTIEWCDWMLARLDQHTSAPQRDDEHMRAPQRDDEHMRALQRDDVDPAKPEISK